MKKRRLFSREFKLEAAGVLLDQGFSYREVCRQLDLEKRVYGVGLSKFSSSAMVVF